MRRNNDSMGMLTLKEAEESEVIVPEEAVQMGTSQEDPEELEPEDLELRGSEWEDDSGDQDENNTGFFYEDDKEEVQEEEEIGIGARVAARR